METHHVSRTLPYSAHPKEVYDNWLPVPGTDLFKIQWSQDPALCVDDGNGEKSGDSYFQLFDCDKGAQRNQVFYLDNGGGVLAMRTV